MTPSNRRNLDANGPAGEVLSTRDVAKLLGVSEATVKRWSDGGLLSCKRTPGGHRKFRRADVAHFVASHPFGTPESAGAMLDAPRLDAPDALALALAGDAPALSNRTRLELQRGRALAELLDDVLRPSLYEIGEQWACAGATVADEHLVSGVVVDVLGDLARAWAPGEGAPIAVVACLAGERHDIGARMAALVLRSRGFRVLALGADTPTADLVSLVRANGPGLVALSASIHATSPLEDAATIAAESRPLGARVVVGGGAFDPGRVLPPGLERGEDMRAFDAMLRPATA